MHNIVSQTRQYYTAFAIFAFLTFILPIRRPIMEGITTELKGVVDNLFDLMPFIPIFAMILIYYQHRYGQSILGRLADRLANIRVWYYIGMVIMPLSIIMFILKVPGVWWTWSTLGLHLATMILLAGFLRDRLRPASALLVAGAIISLAAGSWEMVYQIGLYIVYYRPEGVGMHGLAGAILFIYPMALGGIAVMLQIYLRHPSTGSSRSIAPKFNRWSVALLTFSILGLIMWHVTGFWVDVLYNLDTKEIYYQEGLNYASMLSYKSSKVALGLGLAFLYLPQKDDPNRLVAQLER